MMRSLRVRIADGLTHVISGGGPVLTAFSALCMSGIILVMGAGLAHLALNARTAMKNSTILHNLLPELTVSEKPRPEKTAVFLRYVNALAPAVLNLEVLPEKQLAAFEPLYAASQTWRVMLSDFDFDEQSGIMRVSCSAETQQDGQNFYQSLRGAGCFENIVFLQEETWNHFSIKFSFLE